MIKLILKIKYKEFYQFILVPKRIYLEYIQSKRIYNIVFDYVWDTNSKKYKNDFLFKIKNFILFKKKYNKKFFQIAYLNFF